MLPVSAFIWSRGSTHLEGDPTFLLLLLLLTLFSHPLLQDRAATICLVLLHVRQVVDGILRQGAEAFGHHPRVGVQDGGQVGLGQLLPVVERE